MMIWFIWTRNAYSNFVWDSYPLFYVGLMEIWGIMRIWRNFSKFSNFTDFLLLTSIWRRYWIFFPNGLTFDVNLTSIWKTWRKNDIKSKKNLKSFKNYVKLTSSLIIYLKNSAFNDEALLSFNSLQFISIFSFFFLSYELELKYL